MKLKMAKNSLFAVLLRSPWWMSLAVVGVFVMASIALLPPKYVVFGVMGSFPFLVITVMAAWRQWHAPDPAKVAQALEKAGAMSWKDFSQQVESGFVRQGYTVTRLSGGAADFQLTKAERVTLVSCKRWKAASQGVHALRDLIAAKDAQDAQQAMLISLGAVSAQATRYAKEQGLFLMTEPELAQLLTP
jgi:restriction system protein